MKLHGYFRSSASYRVRIALNLKGLSADHLPHHLRKGEQRDPAYLAINPQGLVPTLQDDRGAIITQSLAIIEWLEETHPEPPLLPQDPLRRAKVRAFALALACDTHPVQNLNLRNIDRRRERALLLRRGADHGRSLSGAAACQWAAFWGRPRRLSSPAQGGSGCEKQQGVRGRRAGAPARCRIKPRP